MKRLLGMTVMCMGMAACVRYAHPSPQALPALSANANMVSAAMDTYIGTSKADIAGMSCDGNDYRVNVKYSSTFPDLNGMQLQYQVLPRSAGFVEFTQATGVMDLAVSPSGETDLVIPGEKVASKDSHILVRLRISTPSILQNLSTPDEVVVSDTCH